MNKKIWLSLGTIAATVSPVIAVVSCSPGTTMGENEARILSRIRSSAGLRMINNQWLDVALKDIYKQKFNALSDLQIKDKINVDLKSIIKFDLERKIRKSANQDYLSKKILGAWKPLLTDPKDKTDLSSKYLLNDPSFHGIADWETAMKGLPQPQTIDNFLDQYLFDKTKQDITSKTDFLLNAKQTLIIKSYLSVDKDQWLYVFGDKEDERDNKAIYKSNYIETRKQVFDLIDKNNFALNIEGIEKHYAEKWNVTINNEKFAKEILARPTDSLSATDMAKEFVKLKNVSVKKNLANYSLPLDTHKIVNKTYMPNTLSATEEKYKGFGGITSMPGTMNEVKWDWKRDTWKNKKDTTIFDGFIQDGDFKSGIDKVKYFKDKKTLKLSLDLYKGLIPTYGDTFDKNGTPIKDSNGANVKRIKFNPLSKTAPKINQYDLDKLKIQFALLNKNLYKDALTYYTNRKNPIRLDAPKWQYKDLLLDLGIKFIKE